MPSEVKASANEGNYYIFSKHMSAKLLLAKPLKQELITALQTRIKSLKNKGVSPYLKIVLVGENFASKKYTSNKKKLAELIGAKCEIVELPENVPREEFLKTVSTINSDQSVHGAMIQLPLPSHLCDLEISRLIDAHKDVDGFHPDNIFNTIVRKIEDRDLAPCTPKGVIKLLNFNNIKIEGKNIAVIGRSMIVGKPLANMLTNLNATVTLCHSRTQNIRNITKEADIIITAIGQHKFLTSDFINSSGEQVLIDVGINCNEEGKTCGDMDFENLIDRVAAITPVPGSVGPLTIMCLAENLVTACENQIRIT